MFTDKIDSMVAKLKDDEKFRSEYMAGAAWFVDAKKKATMKALQSKKPKTKNLLRK